ncbi:hypothetical protein [Bifidobacterium simiarum]|uniref:hypothetical protein n=1 Tax=Bifidobacterium simiarum TaxID=2045441 RepID=UPI001054D1ED|nr:hypothetical protein [Bifidobacterium simiarum]
MTARRFDFPADRRTVFVSTQPGTIAVTGRTLSLRHVTAAIAHSPSPSHSPSSSHNPGSSHGPGSVTVRRPGSYRAGSATLART